MNVKMNVKMLDFQTTTYGMPRSQVHTPVNGIGNLYKHTKKPQQIKLNKKP
jgi:hypothetical protein